MAFSLTRWPDPAPCLLQLGPLCPGGRSLSCLPPRAGCSQRAADVPCPLAPRTLLWDWEAEAHVGLRNTDLCP